MARTIKYPVGLQTFSKLREGNYLYVDKTGLIYELVHNTEYVFLSRPRRFGKSLLISTLEDYFKGKKELFEGLSIATLETKWEKFPVFRFDLSPSNYDSPEKLISLISRCLTHIEEEYNVSSDCEYISDRFIDLIRKAYERYGKRVVVLIDEYDKPMLDCIHDTGLHDKLKAELRGFYASIKACDRYIRFILCNTAYPPQSPYPASERYAFANLDIFY